MAYAVIEYDLVMKMGQEGYGKEMEEVCLIYMKIMML